MLRFSASAVRARGAHLLPQLRHARGARHGGPGRAQAARAARRLALVRAVSGARRLHKDTQALRDHLFDLRKKGFNRLYQDGRTFEFSTPESLLDIDFSKPVFVLVDRLAIPAEPGPELRQRLVDTVEIGYREAGEMVLEEAGGWPRPRSCASARSSPASSAASSFVEPEPRLFSFNNPFGACPRCQGFGNTIDFDMDLVIPDKTAHFRSGGAVEPWTKPKYQWWLGNFRKTARGKGVRWNVPFCDLSEKEQETGLRGHPQLFRRPRNQEVQTARARVPEPLPRLRLCPDCRGARLRKEALYIRVGDREHYDVVRMNIAAKRWRSSMRWSFRRKRPPSPRRS
jgi:excinuclease ABC subunit A